MTDCQKTVVFLLISAKRPLFVRPFLLVYCSDYMDLPVFHNVFRFFCLPSSVHHLLLCILGPTMTNDSNWMYATPESLPRLTAAEYLDWENQQEIRHELVDGYLYAMTGASLRHDEISMNLAAALYNHLAGSSCRVYKSDIKVQVANNYYYPDIIVRCDDGQSTANEFSLADPMVIIEVLSPSTQRFDRGDKRLAYQQINSLTDYLLVSQDSMLVEHFRADGSVMTLKNKDDVLSIEGLQFSILLAQIYQ